MEDQSLHHGAAAGAPGAAGVSLGRQSGKAEVQTVLTEEEKSTLGKTMLTFNSTFSLLCYDAAIHVD
jgi:hypothetical protein